MPGLLLGSTIEPRKRLLKALFDRLGAWFLLIVTGPLLVIVALVIKLTSRGPVLFVQPRYGENRCVVNVYKFRTLYQDCCDPPTANEVKPVSMADRRVTPVGRFLRRTSLDELPQLFNVLKGEMSLVGPRPQAIPHDEFYAAQIQDYWSRYCVKPGITGWAQINGLRGEIKLLEEIQHRLDFDMYYINNWSLWFDIWVLLRTSIVVFGQKKAY